MGLGGLVRLGEFSECRQCGVGIDAGHFFCDTCKAKQDNETHAAACDALLEKAGRKFDHGKLRWDLLPWPEVGEAVEVLTFGALKYEDDNWKKVDLPRARYFAAALRHLIAWWGGERKDPESGRSHLAHAVCCLLFLMWFDNRDAKEAPAE